LLQVPINCRPTGQAGHHRLLLQLEEEGSRRRMVGHLRENSWEDEKGEGVCKRKSGLWDMELWTLDGTGKVDCGDLGIIGNPAAINHFPANDVFPMPLSSSPNHDKSLLHQTHSQFN
jgi:hypothetical protein